MPKLKKDKLIWVRQSFGENDLWRYEKIKLAEYNKFLKSEIEMGEKNPFLKMVPAGKLVVTYKTFIEFIQNKYVDKVIFIVIGYFLKIILDKLIN
jgi:hypothetical protein